MIAALSVDNTVEPTSAPNADAPITEKLSYLFAFAANKLLQTDSLQTLRNDTDTADISSADISTDGITTIRDKHT